MFDDEDSLEELKDRLLDNNIDSIKNLDGNLNTPNPGFKRLGTLPQMSKQAKRKKMFEMLITGAKAKKPADHEWDEALALDNETFALKDD